MSNEHAKTEMVELLDEMRRQMREVARIQRARAQITGRATTRKRVTVTTDANGTVTDVRFGSGIADLSYPEIADAFVRASAAAAADAARQVRELMAPLQRRRMAMPTLSDLVEGAPDIRAMIPPLTGELPPQPDSPQPRAEDFQRRDPGAAYRESGW
ncbi:YbaB/EbfC family nucleoid-associated protein [Nocardia niigatensis]|uniref:YbaB/EbfC family nucleoid-associated protein n=1 Tax=Nocardia niigatensis TaxID=209249 RepID=UPI00031D2FB8|nr:YbaB/EbfC family nucleoid-associated protein [Nocardia niigatensis]